MSFENTILNKFFNVNIDSPFVHIYRKAITFILVCFAWIFFRANNTQELGVLLTKLFTDWGTAGEAFSLMGYTLIGVVITITSIFIVNVFDKRITGGVSQEGTVTKLSCGVPIYLTWAVIFAWIILWSGNSVSSFIYFQF